MKLFSFGKNNKASQVQTADISKLVFASTSALERALDGGDNSYFRYFFAIYHCSPDEINGITELRNQLCSQFPDKTVQVGRHFVLWGEPAFKVVSSFYHALTKQAEPQEFREYAKDRYQEIIRKYETSQDLPVPIELSEGQFANDEKLDFYTCLALSNGQLILSK